MSKRMDLSVEKQLLLEGSLDWEDVACLVAIAMEFNGLVPEVADSPEELGDLIDRLQSDAGAEPAPMSGTID